MSVHRAERAYATALALRQAVLREPSAGDERRRLLDSANYRVWRAERGLADAVALERNSGVDATLPESAWLIGMAEDALTRLADLFER